MKLKRPNDNALGDLIITENQLGVGVTENLSTLTVRARGSFTLTGTLAKTEGSAAVTGTGTQFLSELNIGDRIEMPFDEWDNVKAVVDITSDTALTVESPFIVTSSGPATARPSAARFDDGSGLEQVVINDQGNIGVGTAAPRAQLEVSGLGAGDFNSCPVGIRVHSPQNSDQWGMVFSVDAEDKTPGVALCCMQLQDDGGATLAFSVYDGADAQPETFRIDGTGVFIEGQFSNQCQVVNANYAIAVNDHRVFGEAGSAGITITLPDANLSPGRVLIVSKSSGTGDITVTPFTGQTINMSASSRTISTLYSGIELVAIGGGNWFGTAIPAL